MKIGWAFIYHSASVTISKVGKLTCYKARAIPAWGQPKQCGPAGVLFSHFLASVGLKTTPTSLPNSKSRSGVRSPGPRPTRVHYHDGSFSLGARPPAALHTCRTSREVARSVFQCAFPHDDKNKDLPPIYIDLTHDIIYLTASSDRLFAFQMFTQSSCHVAKIQSPAVEPSLSDIMMSFGCPS